MCGIFGVWHRDRSTVDRGRLVAATRSLRHRGPDDEGFLVESVHQHDDLGVGFRRLAIQDLSERGHQPMVSVDGRWTILFNGEIYNHHALRPELAREGWIFQSSSDTETLLAAFARWGPSCLSRLNGMWALAVWDREARELTLARDRFGVKPLFLHVSPDRVLFASEAKAIFTYQGRVADPDPLAVARFIAEEALPDPGQGETFFQGLEALPPGTLAVVRPEGIRRTRWYRLPADETMPVFASDEECVAAYRVLLEDAVRLRLLSDVPVGTCLSGGLDSSAIVGVITDLRRHGERHPALGDGATRTFSAVYTEAGPFNEDEHIQTAIRANGARGAFCRPDATGLERELDRLIWHQEEPFLSTSIYAQWCVMRLVREAGSGVTVLLDGQGADEALGGYRPFDVLAADAWRRSGAGPAAAWHAAKEIGDTLPQRAGRVARAALWRAPASVRGSALRLRRRVRAKPLTASLRSLLHDATPFAVRKDSLQQHLRDLTERVSLPHLLRYEDRNAMAFGIEARVPFVDYRLIELAFGPGRNLRFQGGWTKWLLREAAAGVVPESIRWRRDKVGFATPESQWLTALLERRPGLLGVEAAREFLSPEPVRGLAERWRRNGSGGAGDRALLWRSLMVELWMQSLPKLVGERAEGEGHQLPRTAYAGS
jgi:asparagine synthase (glutamine-hydrolysing)